MKQQKTVESPAPNIAELQDKRALIHAIMSGSAAMRNKTYLPQYAGESDADYKTRCTRTFLDNFVDIAITKATGKIFSKPITVTDVPAEIEALIENIDRQGRALDPFIMDVAEQAFQDGISYVMIDMPQTEGVVTVADEKAIGAKPYAIHVKPSRVLEVLSEMINGVDTLTRVRIKECVNVPVAGSWDYTDIEQVRVWYREPTGLIRWELWREDEKADQWNMVEEGATTFKSIYLVPFYTNRTGYMLGEPGFQNIAESTLEHFQLKSDYQAALEMCNFGMYWATGVPDDFQMKVGPRQSLTASQPEAQFGVMETTGAAVTLSLDAIKAVEARIEVAGVDLRVERAGTVSATAAAIDSADTNAGLVAIAGGFSDSIELMFQYFAEIMGLDASNAGEAAVCTDFATKTGTDAGLQSLDKARAIGDISREAYVSELIRRGELDESFDVEADAELLSQQLPDLSTIVAPIKPKSKTIKKNDDGSMTLTED